MNWKDAPHLFANGKFGIDWNNDRDGTLLGYSSDENLIEVSFKTGRNSWCFLANCTLIARPISDMTDKERKGIWPRTFNDINTIIKRIKNNDLMLWEAQKLADLGVYFLDDDTDVIFKPNI